MVSVMVSMMVVWLSSVSVSMVKMPVSYLNQFRRSIQRHEHSDGVLMSVGISYQVQEVIGAGHYLG